MNIIRDYIIVKVSSVFIKETKVTGLDGKPLIINVFHRPEHHTRVHGIAVSVPKFLGRYPVIQNPMGRPDGKGKYDMFKRMNDIELEIRVGDKVYFHYNCLLPNRHYQLYNHFYMYSQKEKVGEEMVDFHYFRIKYDLCFAAVRYVKANDVTPDWDWNWEDKTTKITVEIDPCGDELGGKEDRYIYGNGLYRKEITMIGSYVFVEPDMETWKDISIPVPMIGADGKPMTNKDGSPMMKPEDQWIVTKSMPEERDLQGWVRYIGSPLRGDSHWGLKQGMKIVFRPLVNTKIEFEGKEYFRMRQRHINAYVDNRAVAGA